MIDPRSAGVRQYAKNKKVAARVEVDGCGRKKDVPALLQLLRYVLEFRRDNPSGAYGAGN